MVPICSCYAASRASINHQIHQIIKLAAAGSSPNSFRSEAILLRIAATSAASAAARRDFSRGSCRALQWTQGTAAAIVHTGVRNSECCTSVSCPEQLQYQGGGYRQVHRRYSTHHGAGRRRLRSAEAGPWEAGLRRRRPHNVAAGCGTAGGGGGRCERACFQLPPQVRVLLPHCGHVRPFDVTRDARVLPVIAMLIPGLSRLLAANCQRHHHQTDCAGRRRASAPGAPRPRDAIPDG